MNDDLGLRGPKIRIIMSATVGEKILHAIAYRDIFDEKGTRSFTIFCACIQQH